MAPISNDDLCLSCISLVGGDRHLVPHAELRRAENASGANLFQCLACDAWWDVRELGWSRLSRSEAWLPDSAASPRG